MKNSNINPDLQFLLNRYTEYIKNNFNCVEVGQIETFYPNDKTADVNICFKQEFNGEIKNYPLLLKCPVMGNKITLPIEKGEFCLVLFNDKNIDGWWETGQTQQPKTTERHNLSDGIVITGLNSLIDKIEEYDNENISLNHNSKINGDLEVNGETTINGNTTINGITTINNNTEIKGDITITGNIEQTGNNIIKGNTDSMTYSTNNIIGITGVFTNDKNQKLVFTNGLITAIQ